MLETKDNEYIEDMHHHDAPPPPFNPEYAVSSSSEPTNPPPPLNPEYRGEDSIRSVTSAPARMDDYDIDMEEEHLFPPFASAVPMEEEETVEAEPSVRFPAKEEPPIMPAQEVEHVVMDDETPSEEGRRRPGTKAQPSNSTRSFREITHNDRGECWLMPYARILIWKTQRLSHAVLKKAVKVTQDPVRCTQRTIHCVKEKSQRSAVFVKEHSIKLANRTKELAETHQVGPKASYTAHMMGRQAKRAGRSLRDLETKHHLWSKSKYGVSCGAYFVKDLWNGHVGRHDHRRTSI
jgi:hypothetical protein